MKLQDIEIGKRVRTTIEFYGVPKGTEGVIDEDYITGFMVAWDGPSHHARLPANYQEFDGQPAIVTGILRDGFDKTTELDFLEEV